MKQKDNRTPESVQYFDYNDDKTPINNPIFDYIYSRTEFKIKNSLPYVFSIILGVFLLTGKPWWLPKNCLKSIGIVFLFIGIFLLILGIIMIGYLIYFRSVKKLNILSVEMKKTIRYIFKNCCDIKNHKSKSKKYNEKIINILCGKIITYFKILKRSNDDGVGVAIRLAVYDKSNKIVFKTYTRSNLDAAREFESQDIPIDQGIPNYLNKKANSGFFIYNNIDKAHEEGTYFKTKNDRNHPKEIKSLIVVPLTYKGEAKILGLLYITSSEYNYFDKKDKSHLEAFADLTSMAIDFLQISVNTINKEIENEN
jgi:hypothetical protein